MDSKRAFGMLRIAFGVVWGVDAYLKWSAAFQSGLPGYLASAAQGQPTGIAAWINLWLGIVSAHPHLFAFLVALIESALAVSLLVGIFTRIALIGGAVFSFLLWSVAEAFGGPYSMPGMTDVGAAIIYLLVFAALWMGKSWQAYSLDEAIRKKRPNLFFFKERKSSHEMATSGNRWMASAALLFSVVLVAIVGAELMDASAPQSMGVGAMVPMGMTVATYNVNPSSSIPTVSFTIAQDPTSMGGWDVHITTTHFAFTPENVNQPPVPNQGHVHLYVDATMYVVYGPWFHLDGLPPGQHVITVALAANDHSIYALNGSYIQTQKTITQN